MAKTLVEVLQENNIELERSGERMKAICPFHKEDSPSFTVYPTETYYCFGCDAWGDAIKFLCEYKGLTFKEAQEYVGVDYEFKKADKAKVIKVRNTSETYSFLYRISQLYHANLLKTEGAWNYLINRGLTAETIYDNLLGYTDGRVLNFQFTSEYALGLEAGIINKQGFETLSHRITIPNINSTAGNSVDFIMGRTVVNDKVKYLGTRLPKPVYGFIEVWRSPIVFMTEGQFDWLMLKQWGYPSVLLSGSHLPKYQLSLFKDKTVIIVPDNDEPGAKSARSLHATLNTSYILDYSKLGVKDVGELGAKQDGEKLFSEIVREQEWYNILTSKETYQRYLPNSVTTTDLDSIWRQQV